MVRIRQACVVGMLALGLFSGCKKEAATSGSGDKTAEAPGGTATSGDDLSLLPADSEVVMGLNWGQLQQSQLWKQFVEPKLQSSDFARRMAEIKTRCGWDPMPAVTSLSFGIKNTQTKPQVVAVIHGPDKTKTLDCLDKSKDEIAKQGTEITRDGDVILLKDKRGETTAITFVNNNTAVGVSGDNATAAGVKAVAAGGSTLKTSPAFVDMYKKVKTSDSLWVLASGKVLDKAPIKATAAYGSINVTDGLALDARVRFEKPEDATQAASMASAQTKQAAQYFDKADIVAEGNEVHASIAMSNQKLQQLIQQVGPMLGMFMGGMGGMSGGGNAGSNQ